MAVVPTLTGMSSLGKLQNEAYIKNTGLSPLPIPLNSDDETTEVFGLTGAIGTMTLQGKFTGEISTLSGPAAELRAIASADPTITRTFTSDLFPSGLDTNVLQIQFAMTHRSVSILEYEIKLVVGTVVT